MEGRALMRSSLTIPLSLLQRADEVIRE